MRPHVPGGQAHACRRPHAVFLLSLTFMSGPVLAAAADLRGTVVDPDGRPLPRAFVRVVGAEGSEVFTDESGEFRLPAAADCRVEASLAGFRTGSVPCAEGNLRLELALAPIEETVVVTATRTEAPASQVGVATTSFDAREIERRQAPRVADLLRTAPGVMVLQTGAPGGVTGLFVRGGESTYNRVLLDGIPLNEPGGTFNFNNLSTENLERIELVRGANSSLFGSDAMSSVVQLFTRRGTGGGAKPSVSAQLDGGSYGTLHASAAASGAVSRFDYSVAAARLTTDNRVPNNGFDNTTVSASVGTLLGANTTLRAVTRAEIGRTGTPGQTVYGRPDRDAFFDQEQVAAGLTLDQRVTRRFRQRATYALAATNQASVNLVEDAPFTPTFGARQAPFEWYDFRYDTRNRLRRHFASYQADWRLASGGRRGDHLLTALADWNGERASLSDRLTSEATRASRNNVGVSLQHQMVWRRVSASVGGRIENNTSFGTAAVPRVSMVYTLRESGGALGDTRLRGAAGLGIKEPTILQSFSLSPYFRGNPNLRPERSRSIELGVEQRLAGDRMKLEATWFDNRYRNIIGLLSTGGFLSEYANIGLTRARGAEFAADMVPHRSLRLRAGYTLVHSAIVESTSDFSPVYAVGNWAFRRPRHSGYLNGAWSWNQLTFDVTGTFVGRFVDSDFASFTPPILQNPGWTTWDARAAWRATPRLTALLAVDNLTSRDYQQPLGYLALRRAVRAGVRVGF
jgi:vitamin B12 transporter